MKFKWGDEQQKAFKKIKAKVVESTTMAYHNLNKPFVIYIDASKYAMEGIMTQDEQLISCFSKKFNKAQMKYPTTKQELLSIMETFKYHHNIIYGWEIITKTEHKNQANDPLQHKSQLIISVYWL